jgi:pimeloyl-ACP methyl ester carboxylesterase
MTQPPRQFIQAGDHRVAFVEGGAGPGKQKVLLVHGWIASHQLYRKVWDDLAAVCHYRAVDLVGFGDSDKPDPKTTPYTPAWYGAQLQAFLDASGWNECVVAAQSMGGMAAVELALAAPSRVKKLILVDSAGIAQPPPILGRILQTPGIGPVIYALAGTTRKAVGDFLKNDVYFVKSAFDDAVLDDMVRILKSPGGKEAAYATMMRMVAPKAVSAFTPRLRQLTVPTSLIWGEGDSLFPVKAAAEVMKGLIPGATLEVVRASGHEPMVETPAAFMQAFRRALPTESDSAAASSPLAVGLG